MVAPEFKISEEDLICHKKRKYVRSLVQSAIKSKKLTRPSTCELCFCKDKPIEAHHKDYGKPYDVVWLCKSCHTKAHKPDSPLNPSNNHQSPMPYVVQMYKNVQVSFNIPIETFLSMKRESDKLNKSISTILREYALKQYPIYNPQLQFNFEVKNDFAQQKQNERIQSMEQSERLLLQSECAMLQEIRRQRDYNLQRVEGELPEFLRGHGTDSRRMQWACLAR